MSPSGASILITSAPRSASKRVQCGPAIVVVKSRTRSPENALSISFSLHTCRTGLRLSLLTRIARGSLSFKCKAPTAEVNSQTSPIAAHKTAAAATAPQQSRSLPAYPGANVDGVQRDLTATGWSWRYRADRPSISVVLLSRQAASDRGAPGDL